MLWDRAIECYEHALSLLSNFRDQLVTLLTSLAISLSKLDDQSHNMLELLGSSIAASFVPDNKKNVIDKLRHLIKLIRKDLR